MILTITNIISVISGAIMLWAVVSIYRYTRSRSVLWMLVAIGYLLCVRALVSGVEIAGWGLEIKGYTSYLILPFWPMMALGFVMLRRSLVSTMHVHDGKYIGPERRKNL